MTGVASDTVYPADVAERSDPIVTPEHALLMVEERLLIVEERLKEQQAEGVRMPEGMPLEELALRILIGAETGCVPEIGWPG